MGGSSGVAVASMIDLSKIDACWDDEAAYELFDRVRFGHPRCCPFCRRDGLEFNGDQSAKYAALRYRMHCPACRQEFAYREKTILGGKGYGGIRLPLCLAVLATLTIGDDAERAMQDEWIKSTLSATNLSIVSLRQHLAAGYATDEKAVVLCSKLLTAMGLPLAVPALVQSIVANPMVVNSAGDIVPESSIRRRRSHPRTKIEVEVEQVAPKPTQEKISVASKTTKAASTQPESRVVVQSGLPEEGFEWSVNLPVEGLGLGTFVARSRAQLFKLLGEVVKEPTGTITFG